MSSTLFDTTKECAARLDKEDNLSRYRQEFHMPIQENGDEVLYFTGNSLGLQPKRTKDYIQQELTDWANLGVEGHFHAKNPWMPYHELLTDSLATLVGAETNEVVAMNTLSTNLHLLMVSFYRPTANRYKILLNLTLFHQINMLSNLKLNIMVTIRWTHLLN